MAYMIGGIIIYLILILFFWSLCAINNRRSFEESENLLGSGVIHISDLECRKIPDERTPLNELKGFEKKKKRKKAYWKMINEGQKKWRAIEQKEADGYELWKKHHDKLLKI